MHNLRGDGGQEMFAAWPVVFGNIASPVSDSRSSILAVEGLNAGTGDAENRHLSQPSYPYADVGADDRFLVLGGLGLLLVGAAILLRIKKAPD